MEEPEPTRREIGISEVGLDPHLGAVVAREEAERAVVVGTAVEAEQHRGVVGPPAVGQHGHPLGAELARPRPSLVGMVHGLEEGEVGPYRRVDVRAEDGHRRGRPRLVAVAEHADGPVGAGHGVDEGHRADAHGAVAPVGHRPVDAGVVELHGHLDRPQAERPAGPLEVADLHAAAAGVGHFGLESEREYVHAVNRRGTGRLLPGRPGCRRSPWRTNVPSPHSTRRPDRGARTLPHLGPGRPQTEAWARTPMVTSGSSTNSSSWPVS
jgi:hypothetical protein